MGVAYAGTKSMLMWGAPIISALSLVLAGAAAALSNSYYLMLMTFAGQKRWRTWAADPEGITGDALLAFINGELFPALKELPANGLRQAALSLVLLGIFLGLGYSLLGDNALAYPAEEGW